MSEIWNLIDGKKFELSFNGCFQPVEREGVIFNRFVGTVARKPNLCSINYLNWRKVPNDYKEMLDYYWGIKILVPKAIFISKILNVSFMWLHFFFYLVKISHFQKWGRKKDHQTSDFKGFRWKVEELEVHLESKALWWVKNCGKDSS